MEFYRKFWFCFFIFIFQNANAFWTEIEEDNSERSLYVDYDSLKESGYGTFLIWHLVDFSKNQKIDGKLFLSEKAQGEYDCNKLLRRDKLHLWHKDNMGNNKLMHFSYVPSTWVKPKYGSVEELLMKVVCEKN
tara:strand:- start:108 stop:506 length:399 start_codon:yes stop_codon:yes gene_type:complete